MSIANQTPFAVQPVPLLDREGNDVLVAIVKATFVVDRSGGARLADDPAPVRVADEPWEPESPRSSLRFPSDLGVAKLGTDVVVTGDAIAPEKVRVLDVAVRVRQRLTPLRVHGQRFFFKGVLGVGIGPAAPFERVPIVYERAYGGMSEDLSVVDLRNPSGVGAARSAADLVDTQAPQIEHPERPHASASDRHAPVGFGAIMMHWSPRLEHAGTFDERWKATRMPLPPEDQDIRFGNVAHPSLQFEEHLAPGDPVGIVGMSLEPVVFALPGFPVVASARYDTGERVVVRPPIDTVLIQPEARRVELVARAVFPIGRGRRVLREVVVRGDG
ncbi:MULTISPECIES: DUF2169 family type VI secretion system accessory protein [Sorangium]|uniref:DUF2169 domain-containing protein n=1 Tax=Sorangium cellulosum (strain So ce56) TaxID=448385 RepID=A9EZG7_SORC5|nr:DUF2169 domain-containing protein [Sorangium cellulosum]CAN97633.1 hypothetical protein sce7464 [Sorangium cellulosum So ce56]